MVCFRRVFVNRATREVIGQFHSEVKLSTGEVRAHDVSLQPTVAFVTFPIYHWPTFLADLLALVVCRTRFM